MAIEPRRPSSTPIDEILTERYGDLFESVRRGLSEILNVSRQEIEPATVILDLGAQSFDFVELVFRLGREYQIELPTLYMIPNTHTVDTFVHAIASALVSNGTIDKQ